MPGLLSNVATLTRTALPTNANQANIQPIYEVYANVQGRDLGSVASEIDWTVAGLQKGALSRQVRWRKGFRSLAHVRALPGLGWACSWGSRALPTHGSPASISRRWNRRRLTAPALARWDNMSGSRGRSRVRSTQTSPAGKPRRLALWPGPQWGSLPARHGAGEKHGRTVQAGAEPRQAAPLFVCGITQAPRSRLVDRGSGGAPKFGINPRGVHRLPPACCERRMAAPLPRCRTGEFS